MRPDQVEITLANGLSLAVDTQDARFPYWKAVLERSETEQSPVFVQRDEGRLSYLAPSARAPIAALYDDDVTEVSFWDSHAVIAVEGPDKDALLATLREAQAAAHDVHYAYHGGSVRLLTAQLAGPSVAPAEVTPADKEFFSGGLGSKDNPLTMKQARELFAMIVREAELIPFPFAADCCFTRAAEMRRRFGETDIVCGKAYAQAHMAEVPVPTRLVPKKFNGNIRWTFHIAPLAYVREGGVTAEAVIDPSMFDDVVPREHWVKSMPDSGYPAPQVDAILDGTVYAPAAPWRTSYSPRDWVREAQPVIDQVRKKFTEHWARFYGGKVDWN